MAIQKLSDNSKCKVQKSWTNYFYSKQNELEYIKYKIKKQIQDQMHIKGFIILSEMNETCSVSSGINQQTFRLSSVKVFCFLNSFGIFIHKNMVIIKLRIKKLER